MNQHTIAAAWAEQGFKNLFKRMPTPNELLVILGVSMLETGYGQTWKGAGVGSNNMGAIQAKLPPCDPEHFEQTDSIPQSDGTQKKYKVCFKKYATPEEGFQDLVKQLYWMRPSVLSAAATGDVQAIAQAMYDTTYYGGFGATEAERVNLYADILAKDIGYAAGGAGIKNETFRGSPKEDTETLLWVGGILAAGIGAALWFSRKRA